LTLGPLKVRGDLLRVIGDLVSDLDVSRALAQPTPAPEGFVGRSGMRFSTGDKLKTLLTPATTRETKGLTRNRVPGTR
jgi:hypothetical protein